MIERNRVKRGSGGVLGVYTTCRTAPVAASTSSTLPSGVTTANVPIMSKVAGEDGGGGLAESVVVVLETTAVVLITTVVVVDGSAVVAV